MNSNLFFEKCDVVTGLDPLQFRHSPCGRLIQRSAIGQCVEHGWFCDSGMGKAVHWIFADR